MRSDDPGCPLGDSGKINQRRNPKMIYLRAFGIETFHDPALSKVDFAENDALEFEVAWQAMETDLDSKVVLSDEGTLSRLDFELDDLKGRVTSLDTVVFYFAGHGFHVNGQNRLAVTDTRVAALEKTTIPLEDVYNRFVSLGGQKALMFVDACHSGLALEGRSPIGAFSADDLRRFDVDSRAIVLFASCSSDERSYPYMAEKHGYWTTCLLQALRGDLPEILVEGELLYANDLQECLAQRVPQLIRETRTGIAKQSPVARMDFNQKFVVADLGKVMKARSVPPTDLQNLVDQIEIRGLEKGAVKSLSGFVKGHKVYPTVTGATRAFVVKAGKGELDDLFEALYEGLHSILKFDYLSLKEDRSDDGFSIITPAFDLYVELRQSEEEASEYEIEITVDSFRDPHIVSTPAFSELFEGRLDTLALLIDGQDLKAMAGKLSRSALKDAYKYVPGQYIKVNLAEVGLNLVVTTEEFVFSSNRIPNLETLLGALPAALSGLISGGHIAELPAKS